MGDDKKYVYRALRAMQVGIAKGKINKKNFGCMIMLL